MSVARRYRISGYQRLAIGWLVGCRLEWRGNTGNQHPVAKRQKPRVGGTDGRCTTNERRAIPAVCAGAAGRAMGATRWAVGGEAGDDLGTHGYCLPAQPPPSGTA